MNDKSRSLKEIKKLMILYVTIAFLAIVVLPATSYYFNPDIKWKGFKWIEIFLIANIAGLPIFYFAVTKYNKFHKQIKIFLEASCLYLIIGNFFMPINHGPLDNLIVNFNNGDIPQIILIFLSLLLFATFLEKITEQLLLSSIIIVLFFVIFVYVDSILKKPHDIKSSLEKKTQYTTLSKNKNIIILSFDSIQHDVFIEALEEHPELKKIFDGFTLYKDASSYAPHTMFSVPSTLTGRKIPSDSHGISIDSIKDEIYSNSLLSYLKKSGYYTSLYIPFMLAKNTITASDILPQDTDFTFSAYAVSAFRMLPNYIAYKLIYRKNKETNLLKTIKLDLQGLGFGFDFPVFQKLSNNVTLTDKPVFKFHHYLFTHAPIRFNQRCQYHQDIPQSRESAKNEILCTVHEIKKYIHFLKKLKIYDRTMLLITSDHGYEKNIQPNKINGKYYYGGFGLSKENIYPASRYWPILLVKKYNGRGKIKTSNLPVSLLDIAPSICEQELHQQCLKFSFVGDNFLKGTGQFKHRQRNILYYMGGRSNINDRLTTTKIYESDAFNGDSYNGIYNLLVRKLKASK